MAMLPKSAIGDRQSGSGNRQPATGDRRLKSCSPLATSAAPPPLGGGAGGERRRESRRLFESPRHNARSSTKSAIRCAAPPLPPLAIAKGGGARLACVALVLATSLSVAGAARAEAPAHCAAVTVRGTPYVVCRFDPKADDIRLFHADAEGEPYRHFGRLAEARAGMGERLLFAMNAGMYQANRTPVGLYVENGVTRRPVNNRDCKGNFCLKPNGAFWLSEKDGAVSAHVAPTADYIIAAKNVRDATQSGPMLVIDGVLHPRFNNDSTSLYRRNGVGVTAAGEVVFAISDAPVTFHEFASLFRDELQCPNALYLDGAISRVFSAELGRNEPGAAMGPIVAVVTSAPEGE